MSKYLSKEYMSHYSASLASIRSAGLAVMVVLEVVGALVFRMKYGSIGINPTLFLTTLAIGALAQFAPLVLRPLYAVWMTFAGVLGWVNTRLILGIIFFGLFTPIAFLFRMLGRDSLSRAFDSKHASYRIDSGGDGKKNSMTDPF